MTDKYIKIRHENLAYYINIEHKKSLDLNFSFNAKLMQLAEIVININTNKVLKCRYSLQDLLDKVLINE